MQRSTAKRALRHHSLPGRATRLRTRTLPAREAGDFVHDLRQCVAVLGAVSASLRVRAGADPALVRSVDVIDEQVRMMAGMCAAIAGDRAPPRNVDLGAVVQRAASASAHARGARVLVDVEPATVWGREVAWYRIVANVVDNAARAAGDGGDVRVSLHTHDRLATIEVADDGPGFGASPPGRSGRGLGIVRRLAHEHHATVEIESGAPRGTVVRVRVPLGDCGD